MTDTDTLDVAELPETFRARVVQDETPDTSYLHQEGWGDSLRAYEAGAFDFVGVVLETRCPVCQRWEVVGSLWGIEHDGTQASLGYLEDTARELHSEHLAEQAGPA